MKSQTLFVILLALVPSTLLHGAEEKGPAVRAKTVLPVVVQEAMSQSEEWERLSRLHQLFATWDMAKLKALAKMVDEGPEFNDRHLCLMPLGRRMAVLNAPEAIAFSQNLKGEAERLTVYVFQKWVELDLRQAVNWLDRHPPGNLRDRCIGKLANLHPDLALAALAEGAGYYAHRYIYVNWCDRDPREAARVMASGRVFMNDDFASIAAFSLAALDPKEAIAWLEGVGNPDYLPTGYIAIARQWSRREPEAVFAWAQGLGDMSISWSKVGSSNAFGWSPQARDIFVRRVVLDITCRSWSQSEPGKALQAVLNLQDVGAREALARMVFAQWLQSDREQALLALEKIPPEMTTVRSLAQTLLSPQKTDLDSRISAAEKLPAGPSRDNTLVELCRHPNQPLQKDAATRLYQLQPERLRYELVPLLAQRLAEISLDLAFEWAESLPDEKHREGAFEGAFGVWFRKDPKSASDWRLAGPVGSTRARLSNIDFQNWVRYDPKGAVEWVKKLPEGKDGDWRKSSLISSLSRLDHKACIAVLETITTPASRVGAVESIARWRAFKNPKEAAVWADSLANNSEKSAAQAMLAESWRQESVEEGMAWAHSLSDGVTKANAVRCMAEAWSESNPASIMVWAAKLSDGKERSELLPLVFDKWSNHEPEKAGDWLGRQPAGPERDLLVSRHISNLCPVSPQSAALWVEQITDPKVKLESLLNLGSQWIRFDSKAARLWLDSRTDISEEEKQRLILESE